MRWGICIKGSIKTLPVTALYWIVCLAPWKWAFFSWDWNLERLLWFETAFDSHSPFLAPQLSEELLARASVLVTIDFHRKESELWNLVFLPHPTRVWIQTMFITLIQWMNWVCDILSFPCPDPHPAQGAWKLGEVLAVSQGVVTQGFISLHLLETHSSRKPEGK